MPVPQEVLHHLRDVAKTTKLEVCGVIDSTHKVHCIKNVSSTPITSFIFDKREYFACMKQLLAEGKTILCIFHTHPSGNHTPSDADLKALSRFKRNSLIVSEKGYTWLPYA